MFPSEYSAAASLGKIIQHQTLLSVKGALSDERQFLATESPLKMVKNGFYFILKDIFILEMIQFLF